MAANTVIHLLGALLVIALWTLLGAGWFYGGVPKGGLAVIFCASAHAVVFIGTVFAVFLMMTR